MNTYPVDFELERPASMSRSQVFLRIVILVLVSWLIGSGGGLALDWLHLGFPAAAALLIARKDGERYLTEDGARVARWVGLTVTLIAYIALLTDELPGKRPRHRPCRDRSLRLPDGWQRAAPTFKAVPSALALALLGLVSSVVWLFAAISILVKEEYPEGRWNFQAGIVRWDARLLAYLASLVVTEAAVLAPLTESGATGHLVGAARVFRARDTSAVTRRISV